MVATLALGYPAEMTKLERERWEQLGVDLGKVLDEVGAPSRVEAMLEAVRAGLMRSGTPGARGYAEGFGQLMAAHGFPLAPLGALSLAASSPPDSTA
jgi:hypothetical protein